MRPLRPRPGYLSRTELEEEARFWRNYAALTRFSGKLPPPFIPAQRIASPAEERWDDFVRSAYKTPRGR